MQIPDIVGLQGLYLAQPALELYYLLNHNKQYLGAIYNALERYDSYLWKYRDSDKDGCLETWGMTDNGERSTTPRLCEDFTIGGSHGVALLTTEWPIESWPFGVGPLANNTADSQQPGYWLTASG